MSRENPTEEEIANATAEVAPDWDAILKAATKMMGNIGHLSIASQKQAICQLTMIWIKSIYPDDLKTALQLSKAFHEQVDVYLTGKRGAVN